MIKQPRKGINPDNFPNNHIAHEDKTDKPLMRTKQTNPFEDKTDKPLMRTKQTNPFEDKTDKPLLSKKKLPWPRSVMNIGKGMYTFNITEIKKRTSK